MTHRATIPNAAKVVNCECTAHIQTLAKQYNNCSVVAISTATTVILLKDAGSGQSKYRNHVDPRRYKPQAEAPKEEEEEGSRILAHW